MIAADRDGAVAAALRRAGLYRLLGGAFAYPTAERIGELARAAATIAVNAPSGALRDALASFAAAAYDTSAEVAGGEYVFLFDRDVRCPAYEGAWGDGSQAAGRVARLADIAGFYRAFGLEPAGAQPDSEDHLVAELEFMSAVAMKEAWALEVGRREDAAITRDAETKFMTDHLGRWATGFAGAVAAATTLPYYTAAAALLRDWIEAEIPALGAVPDVIGAPSGIDPLQAEAFACPMAPESPDDDVS